MKDKQIKVITYEQERLDFFTKAMQLAQKRYNRLFKIFKDDPYLSEGTTMVSDAGRESQFYHDVVEMLENGDRKQSGWISVYERLPTDDKKVLAYYGFDHGGEDLHMTFIGVLDYYAHDPTPHFQHESVGLRVTHWMPLPEPPKMKGGAE